MSPVERAEELVLQILDEDEAVDVLLALQSEPGILATAADQEELRRLRAWKAEATEVIAMWDAIWEALGRPGPLGRPKSECVAREVYRMRHHSALLNRISWNLAELLGDIPPGSGLHYGPEDPFEYMPRLRALVAAAEQTRPAHGEPAPVDPDVPDGYEP
jgi:hypothetical protein